MYTYIKNYAKELTSNRNISRNIKLRLRITYDYKKYLNLKSDYLQVVYK